MQHVTRWVRACIADSHKCLGFTCLGSSTGTMQLCVFPDVENAEEGEHDGLIYIYIYTVLKGSNTGEVKFLILVLRLHVKHVFLFRYILVNSASVGRAVGHTVNGFSDLGTG